MTDRDIVLPEGYETWGEPGLEPFEDIAGPFYLKPAGDGTYKSAFISERKHVNLAGIVHGGLLMTFADFAIFAIARDYLGSERGVTVSFNSEFVSAGPVGALIEATGEVTRAAKSLIFVQGKVFTGETTIMPFSAIIKKVKPRE